MMEYPPILSHSFPAPGHGQPRLFNAFHGGAVEHGGIFKADEAAACVQRGNGSCAGAGADVSHHLALVGIGLNEVLAQLHRLLCGWIVCDTVGTKRTLLG